MRALIVIALLASTASADDLENRKIGIAGFGVVWMQFDGVMQSGMALQPTFQRTFDRFELQADYLIADLRDEAMKQPGGVLHRLGVAARYQAGRVRVERVMTLDLVLEAGAGLEYFDRDDGDSIGRNDLALGLGLRTLTDVKKSGNARAFMGMEAMLRMLITPSGDLAFAAMFGVPFGK